MPGSLVGRRCRIGFPLLTAGAFLIGLAVTLGASEIMVRGLTRLGANARLSDGLVGLLSALGADSPELSSAVIALASGAGGVGIGVIVGSNLFNLAALLGLSAVVVMGGVRIRRGALVPDAGAGLLFLLIAIGLVADLVDPRIAALVSMLVAGVYVVILARPGSPPENAPAAGSWAPVVALPAAVAAVAAGALLMVHSALEAQRSLHLSDAVVGTIVLAALTSLPNAWVALRFARAGRGTALFSSAMNSNSINLLGGLIIPAVFVGTAIGHGSLADFGWLALLTLVAILVPALRGRLNRASGAAIIGLYIVFVVIRLSGR